MIIHNVGNKVKGESLEISTEICDANNEVTNQYLKQFFFSTFKFDVTYRFVHETDIAMNEIYNYVEYISDPSYHDVLILRQVQAQYRFEFGEMNGFCIIEYGFPHYFRKYVKGDAFESRLANIYFGKTSKSQNVKNATRLILEEFEKLYQTQYHLCLKR